MVNLSKAGPKAIRRVSSKILLIGRKQTSSSSLVEARDAKKQAPDLITAKTWEDSSTEEGNIPASIEPETREAMEVSTDEKKDTEERKDVDEEEAIKRLEAEAAKKQREATDSIARAKTAMSEVSCVVRRVSIAETIKQAEAGYIVQVEKEAEREERSDLTEGKLLRTVNLATLLIPASIIGACAVAYSIQNELLVLPVEIRNLFSN